MPFPWQQRLAQVAWIAVSSLLIFAASTPMGRTESPSLLRFPALHSLGTDFDVIVPDRAVDGWVFGSPLPAPAPATAVHTWIEAGDSLLDATTLRPPAKALLDPGSTQPMLRLQGTGVVTEVVGAWPHVSVAARHLQAPRGRLGTAGSTWEDGGGRKEMTLSQEGQEARIADQPSSVQLAVGWPADATGSSVLGLATAAHRDDQTTQWVNRRSTEFVGEGTPRSLAVETVEEDGRQVLMEVTPVWMGARFAQGAVRGAAAIGLQPGHRVERSTRREQALQSARFRRILTGNPRAGESQSTNEAAEHWSGEGIGARLAGRLSWQLGADQWLHLGGLYSSMPAEGDALQRSVRSERVEDPEPDRQEWTSWVEQAGFRLTHAERGLVGTSLERRWAGLRLAGGIHLAWERDDSRGRWERAREGLRRAGEDPQAWRGARASWYESSQLRRSLAFPVGLEWEPVAGGRLRVGVSHRIHETVRAEHSGETLYADNSEAAPVVGHTSRRTERRTEGSETQYLAGAGFGVGPFDVELQASWGTGAGAEATPVRWVVVSRMAW